jgi:Peptidase M10 serralysin C terminal
MRQTGKHVAHHHVGDHNSDIVLWSDDSDSSEDSQPSLLAPRDAHRSGCCAGGTGSSGTSGTTTSGTSSSPFVINIVWDASVQFAPSGFTASVLAAVQYLESLFSDPVTININVGYGQVGGASLGSTALGQSETYLTSVSYATLLTALQVDAKTATDTTAVGSLPATNPLNGNFWISTSEAKALGLISGSSTALDGYVGFCSSPGIFDYDNTDGVTAGAYDFYDTVLHEFTEVMGRILLTGSTIGNTPSSYDALDLFHYSSTGVRDFSASTAGYFSVDGGATNLGQFNPVAGGDAGDWASSMGNDAFDAFSNPGVVNSVSTGDLAAMDAIGWDYTPAATVVSSPTGVTIAPAVGALAALQGSDGLNANTAIASVTQVGGADGDTYDYELGGSSASAFSVPTTDNTGALSIGATGLAGGALYSITLTAHDEASSVSSPPTTLDVIVGAGLADAITMGAASPSAPTFIYGLGGADSIDATGLTATAWLVGGAGADTMTGGSGANDYLYGAASDSTAKSMDIITNFHAATDLIDLTGLGSSLKYVGRIANNKLGGHSVGWQESGGNTFVYANTGQSSQNLASTSMKIELQGSIALASSNILHG